MIELSTYEVRVLVMLAAITAAVVPLTFEIARRAYNRVLIWSFVALWPRIAYIGAFQRAVQGWLERSASDGLWGRARTLFVRLLSRHPDHRPFTLACAPQAMRVSIIDGALAAGVLSVVEAQVLLDTAGLASWVMRRPLFVSAHETCADDYCSLHGVHGTELRHIEAKVRRGPAFYDEATWRQLMLDHAAISEVIHAALAAERAQEKVPPHVCGEPCVLCAQDCVRAQEGV